MTRFTVVVLPDGRALFTTEERMDGERTAFLAEQLSKWHDQERPGWAVLMDTKVVRVESLDIDIEAPRGPVQSSEGRS